MLEEIILRPQNKEMWTHNGHTSRLAEVQLGVRVHLWNSKLQEVIEQSLRRESPIVCFHPLFRSSGFTSSPHAVGQTYPQNGRRVSDGV